MYKFLRDILPKKEPDSITFLYSAIPSWLGERRETLTAGLRKETTGPVQNIRNAMARLHLIVNGISDAEHDPALHPKLKTIAKNSLPLFVKAMKASLSRDLPEDAEDFYPAAVECLKGCLNSTRGQGRYLQAVFPDEMKAVRTGIDTIGREINGITTSLAAFRKQQSGLDAIQALYNALNDIGVDTKKAVERERRILVRIADSQNRLEALETELLAASADPGAEEIRQMQIALDGTAAKRDDLIRAYTALSMAASHVFRKTEKVAVRRHPAEIPIIRHAVDLLSDHTVPDPKELDRALAAAAPIAERMVASEEIVLKNREERTIFSDTAQFRADIQRTSMAVMKQETECRSLRDALASHPLVGKTDGLKREKIRLEATLVRERQELSDLREWRAKLDEKIPLLRTDLENKIGEIMGKGVQLQYDQP